MKVAVSREVHPNERRVGMTPAGVEKLRSLGFEVAIEADAGELSGFSDADYEAAGATIHGNRAMMLADAAIIVRVRPPLEVEDGHEVDLIPEGATHISLLWPGQNDALLNRLAERRVSAIALDKIPRISRAQKLDVLSSMANISGYRAVVEAAHAYGRFMGGQMTAAGKTPPAKVLIIGAGVAGLSAIGAARAMGAQVMAFDTRESVRDQVKSLGGTFLEVEFEEDGDGGGGYAKVMSPAFIKAEMAAFRKVAPDTDIVITTALIPGKKAPLLWKTEAVELMKPGSVVVDLAAEQGGNCELT